MMSFVREKKWMSDGLSVVRRRQIYASEVSAKWRDQKMSDFCSPEAGTSHLLNEHQAGSSDDETHAAQKELSHHRSTRENGWHDGIVPMGPAWNDTFCEATETSAHSSAPPPVKRKKPTDVLHLSSLSCMTASLVVMNEGISQIAEGGWVSGCE